MLKYYYDNEKPKTLSLIPNSAINFAWGDDCIK